MSRPTTNSSAMKYSSPTLPKSNTGTMFGWASTEPKRASSMNCSTAARLRVSSGRSRLITNVRWKPSAPSRTAV